MLHTLLEQAPSDSIHLSQQVQITCCETENYSAYINAWIKDDAVGGRIDIWHSGFKIRSKLASQKLQLCTFIISGRVCFGLFIVVIVMLKGILKIRNSLIQIENNIQQ